jgi:hypothetical protein
MSLLKAGAAAGRARVIAAANAANVFLVILISPANFYEGLPNA